MPQSTGEYKKGHHGHITDEGNLPPAAPPSVGGWETYTFMATQHWVQVPVI